MSEHNHAKFGELVQDFATEPVPVEKRVSGIRVGLILGGIGIALPAMLVGIEVGEALGLEGAVRAFLVAGVIVSVMGIFSGVVGSISGLSTYMIIQFAFGRYGSMVINAGFALSQIAWFAVNAYIFGASARLFGAESLGLDLHQNIYTLLGGALMTVGTIFGFKALDKLALIAVPVLIATLFWMITGTFEIATLAELLDVPGSGELTFAQSISVLAGGIMVGIVLLPDLTRYSKSTFHTVIAILIGLALVEPLVHLGGAVPAIGTGEGTIEQILLLLFAGAFALFILLFTSWTSNAVNLYGSGLSLTAIHPAWEEWKMVAYSGLAGTLIAMLFDVPGLFTDFLLTMSIMFTPVVGIYMVDFYLIAGRRYLVEELPLRDPLGVNALVAWGTGIAISQLIFQQNWTLTTVEGMDAALVAAIIYFTLARLRGTGARAAL